MKTKKQFNARIDEAEHRLVSITAALTGVSVQTIAQDALAVLFGKPREGLDVRLKGYREAAKTADNYNGKKAKGATAIGMPFRGESPSDGIGKLLADLVGVSRKDSLAAA